MKEMKNDLAKEKLENNQLKNEMLKAETKILKITSYLSKAKTLAGDFSKKSASLVNDYFAVEG